MTTENTIRPRPAARKRQLTATLPDGSIATRTTHRDYTHVIARHLESGWTGISWTTQPDKALRNELRLRPVGMIGNPKLGSWGEARAIAINPEVQ